MVYVRKDLFPLVHGLESNNKATGLGGFGGNKGGVMIYFRIFETSFCFVNCHLAAGASQLNMDSRRRDAYDILKFLRPENQAFDMISLADYFFWVGDFNFRVDCTSWLS